MNPITNQVPAPVDMQLYTMSFAVAELGAMKASVDSLAYSRNKTKQNKIAKLVVSFLSQMSRVRGGKALNNATLLGYSTYYSMAEDDLKYSFTIEVAIPEVPSVVN